MSKYSWSSYCGTREPYSLPLTKVTRGESHIIAYGMNAGLVRQLTENNSAIEVFEFGRSNGFTLVVEANSGDQAGFLLRKFLKEAVLNYIGMDGEDAPEELELGLDEWTSTKQ